MRKKIFAFILVFYSFFALSNTVAFAQEFYPLPVGSVLDTAPILELDPMLALDPIIEIDPILNLLLDPDFRIELLPPEELPPVEEPLPSTTEPPPSLFVPTTPPDEPIIDPDIPIEPTEPFVPPALDPPVEEPPTTGPPVYEPPPREPPASESPVEDPGIPDINFYIPFKPGIVKPEISFDPFDFWKRENFGYTLPPIAPEAVSGPSGFSYDPTAIATNLLFAILLALIVGLASFLFNNIIEEYGDEINAFIKKIPVLGKFEGVTHKKKSFLRILFLLVILVLFAITASYLSPNFSLAQLKNLGVLIITVISVTLATFTKDFFRYFVALKWKCKALFKPNVMGLLLAVGGVAVSRFFEISPGYLFGIPMGLFIFSKKFEENEGRLEFSGLFLMFLFAGLTWLILPFTQPYEVINDLFNLLFVILLEGVFFELFPLTFLPGSAIYNWNKWLWALFFGLISFLLFHTLFNPDGSFGAIQQNPPTYMTMIILLIFAAISFLLWASLIWFKRKQKA